MASFTTSTRRARRIVGFFTPAWFRRRTRWSNTADSFADAVFPDPFSRRRVSLRDATAAITEYRRSTGDVIGTVDLTLTFIEAGTEQAADLGYGDEDYFSALENKIDAVAKSWHTLPAEARATIATRLAWVQKRAKDIGWGFGDYVDDVVARLNMAGTEKSATKDRTRGLIKLWSRRRE